MKNWLNDAVVYEIYPQSFYDTNGDGIGDLQGIIEKLNYIESLGFTAIWLNPINPSSFRDAGYDVTDFYGVDPRYGTVDDYKALCDAAHSRGMKVIFDLVAGHTSIDHPWFIESAKDEKNEYTNRYIWTDDTFDNSEGIAGYGQRNGNFIKNFFWSQPALNYGFANPDPDKPWQLPVTHPDCVATKNELKRIIDFWIDLGTDAFRVDMAQSLIKGDKEGTYLKAFWNEIRTHMENKNPNCLLISEWGLPTKAINSGFHLDFLLHSMISAYTSLFRYEKGRNTTRRFVGHSYFNKDGKGNINEYLDRFLYDLENINGKGYIGHITGNHDMQRLAYGRTPDEVKVAMTFLFTMPGVPVVYYGDEIGMDYIEGLPSKEGGYNRTGSRTPMQWNDKKNHGFSESDTPYLPTDNREGAPTVESQEKDNESLLSLVKELIKLHRSNPALWAEAGFKVISAGYPFIFERFDGDKKLLIAINPSDKNYKCDVPVFDKVVLSQNAKAENGRLDMGGVSFIIAEI
ncbi:MAG: glycosylase [Clostridia bacterium]|nr:glycosylase [Clostridia bacterium]